VEGLELETDGPLVGGGFDQYGVGGLVAVEVGFDELTGVDDVAAQPESDGRIVEGALHAPRVWVRAETPFRGARQFARAVEEAEFVDGPEIEAGAGLQHADATQGLAWEGPAKAPDGQ